MNKSRLYTCSCARTHANLSAYSAFVVMCLLFAGAGCASDPPAEKHVSSSLDASIDACVDEDHDGFGSHCSMGQDCNDMDAAVTDLCFRCRVPNEGCPCASGTEPMACIPPPYRGTNDNGVSGTYECSDGTRYCAQQMWGPCQALTAYVFVPD